MTLSLSSIHKNIWLIIVVAFVILGGGLLLMHHVSPHKSGIVATGFMADIVVTFPVVYYFLIIKPFKQKLWRIMLVITCCCGVAYLILPAEQQGYIIQLRKLTAGLELGMLIYFISKIRHIQKAYKQLQAEFPDVAFNLHKSMEMVLGDGVPVKIMASEITIVRFGLLCFKREKGIPTNVKRFSIHKNSGYAALFGVIMAVSVIEMVAFHLFLTRYSELAAVIVTILSVYGCLFITGDFSALLKSPVLLLENKLLLRAGLRYRTLVKLDNIASVEKVGGSFEPDAKCFKGGVMKNTFNVLITFKEPVIIERHYTKPAESSQMVLSIDEVDDFIETLIAKGVI
ncbi:hypothetical protein MTO98_32425 [Mucilaginibacter sp. SMC90]|uniref:hypothetical protein n=1 Tax=Mucilaginibacter sp. SMC90 TaxID=2929803 RepID=UPI001FB3B10D|nr:hypothetical protein [Mucilaginibacter sp. SMC90]UOE49104.1 hypothetical protein MTO98_32425 [Mucilaginibacter sp. SMC90]